jgi:hypothetical protein
MLKKTFFYILLALLSVIILNCSRDDIVNAPVHVTKGIFVLCEGSFSTPGDFSIVNPVNDSVANNVYSNSNSGATLGSIPDGIFITSPSIFISSQGNYGGPGKMFRLDYNTYRLLDTSTNFGMNPYDFNEENSSFYVTNTGGSTVTKLSLNLEIIKDGIQVGPNPSKIIFALQSFYIAKQSYTSEYSLAIINEFSDIVTKAFFPAPPVSVANIIGGVHVSTYSWKKLYVLDSIQPNIKKDSILINISSSAIGEIISDGNQSLYIVGVDDTSFQSNIGNKVYKYNVLTKQIDQSFLIQMSPPNDIYGIDYDVANNLIYIANSRGGTINGEVDRYSTNGTLLKQIPIGGKYPRKFAFKYENH